MCIRDSGTTDEFAAKAVTVGVLSTENEDIRSLRELITYGLKGLAAYTSHAKDVYKRQDQPFKDCQYLCQ